MKRNLGSATLLAAPFSWLPLVQTLIATAFWEYTHIYLVLVILVHCCLVIYTCGKNGHVSGEFGGCPVVLLRLYYLTWEIRNLFQAHL